MDLALPLAVALAVVLVDIQEPQDQEPLDKETMVEPLLALVMVVVVVLEHLAEMEIVQME
jgi:hypothetical protein